MPFPTLLDIAKANGSDAVAGLIDETTKGHPELTGRVQFLGEERQIPNVGAARTIKGINYKTLVRTALPAVGFRGANEGVASQIGTYENRLVECFILNSKWFCDRAVADRYEDGAAAYIAIEGSAIVEAAMQTLAKQFYYGAASGGDAKGHPGLIDAVASTMVVDAGGTTASTGSSVWAVKWGPKDVMWAYGNDGSLDLSEVDIRDQVDSGGTNKFSAYHQELLAYPGLQVASVRSIGRIKKLTEDSGKGLTDDVIAKLLATFEVNKRPDVLFASRRSLRQLQDSRTATNATGAPAPFPSEAFGIPIAVTDAILDTEALTL